MSGEIRVGQGFDVHALVTGRRLLLGGVEVPSDRGLEGHSDGDVLLHAVASALLGAVGEGDLGRHFPSSDPRYRGAASAEFVTRAYALCRERGYALGNLDCTVVAQAPRLAPHTPAMRERIAKLLDAPAERINVKVTSTDGLGAIGRGDGIAAQVIVLLERA